MLKLELIQRKLHRFVSFAADHSCQNDLQLSKKNRSLEENSSVLCKSLEIGIVSLPSLSKKLQTKC